MSVKDQEKGKICTFFKKSGKRSAVRKRRRQSSDDGEIYVSSPAHNCVNYDKRSSFKGWSLPYTLYLDLRPGSPGGHRVTKVFLTWSLGHSTKFAVPRSCTEHKYGRGCKEHGVVHHRLSSNTS